VSSENIEPPQSAPSELSATRERLMQSERELQAMRLELEEKERALRSAQHDLGVQQKQMESALAAMTQARTEQMFSELAAPVAQIVTQSYLFATENKLLQPKDVIAAAKRIVACLKNHGLQLEGEVGEICGFDGDLHEPLSLDESVQAKEPVMVRMVGISYQGKILRRAAVTRQSASEPTSR